LLPFIYQVFYTGSDKIAIITHAGSASAVDPTSGKWPEEGVRPMGAGINWRGAGIKMSLFKPGFGCSCLQLSSTGLPGQDSQECIMRGAPWKAPGLFI